MLFDIMIITLVMTGLSWAMIFLFSAALYLVSARLISGYCLSDILEYFQSSFLKRNFQVFYAIDGSRLELETFVSEQRIDPVAQTFSVMTTLEIFCRQVKLLLDMGLDPGLLREEIDPQNGIRSFCELCVRGLSEALDKDQSEL